MGAKHKQIFDLVARWPAHSLENGGLFELYIGGEK